MSKFRFSYLFGALLFLILTIAVTRGAGRFPGLERQMRFGLGESATALYFSFVTVTTLGYGDIIPATDSSRLLAAMQAFLGQAYIAILVAKLVGQYVVAATSSGDQG